MSSSQVVYVWWSLLWAPSLASWVQVAIEHRLRAVYAASAWDLLHVVPVVATRLFTVYHYQQSTAKVTLAVQPHLACHELSKARTTGPGSKDGFQRVYLLDGPLII